MPEVLAWLKQQTRCSWRELPDGEGYVCEHALALTVEEVAWCYRRSAARQALRHGAA